MKFAISLFKALLVIFVAANTLGLYLLFNEVTELKRATAQKGSTVPVQAPVSENVDLSIYATKDYVDESVASSKPTKTETVVVVQKTASPQKQTTIIPISTNFSTQSLDWIDVPNSDFYLDLAGDYGEGATAYWEAFIHEQHGNGKAYARLFDVTHSIAVVGSDVETNSATTKLEASWGNLAIWRGKNLYRAQIKSQKSFPVFFNSGRLKITY